MEIVSNAVAVIVCRNVGSGSEVLLMQRAKGFLRGQWSQLTGRIEEGELAWQAAAREIREETGLSEFDLYSAGYCDAFYNPEADRIEMLPIFVARLSGRQEVILNPENTEHQWVNAQEVDKLLPFVGHRIAIREFILDFVERSPPEWRLIWRNT